MSSPRAPPESMEIDPTPTSPKASSPTTGRQLDNLDRLTAPIEVTLQIPHSVTDTLSLKSSIFNYKWEYGRRYHAFEEGTYWAPNDERQQEAEDMVHEMYRIVLEGRLTLAPDENLQHVLDVGCGTGVWAIVAVRSEFADEHPEVEVIGVDLSPIQPPFVPPNCRFEVDDINKRWTYPKNYFDLVHIRSMSGCVPDWVAFYKKVLKHLKPGAWIEHVELSGVAQCDDDTLPPGSAQRRWIQVFKQIGEAIGRPFDIAETAGDLIREAGFVNVHEWRLKIPIGTWPKDKELKQWGAWNRLFLLQGLEGFSIKGLTDALGWSYEQAQLYLAELRKEVTDDGIHSYIDMLIIDAQKADETTA
ncbi:hypothetical protein SAPIO_CDS3791 [Scedosporium apiospermum]|uniref:S-adenosyl-L-methionine-dependent methyltransferase n=1 Tax=Pseudallescheria apiosperma TaxID=563466 RepID=A0A084G9P0_PSEDA|nr:uncharacterized protein SAPIO_CDS3791 [Scedosporium apiospermum]KEZ44052.1 hypothetical protein SAPIO_CDS3791 [Scedosporium apiospermum]